MKSKKFVKAFIAGMALPAVVLPIIYTLLYFNVRGLITARTLQFVPMFLPLAWGLANALCVKVQEDLKPRSINNSLLITGACLGFLVAVFGIFIAHIPTRVFGPNIDSLQFLPLILVPIIYALLFRYVVKWLNKLVGV